LILLEKPAPCSPAFGGAEIDDPKANAIPKTVRQASAEVSSVHYFLKT